MQDSTNEKRIMKRRGRPRKSKTDNSPIRKPKALRLSDEEEKYIANNARKCRMNFSEYCRKVLMSYKPSVPDTGIFLSWPNFWAMITLTIYSATIAIFAAVYLCDWSRLWAEVWIPFTFLLSSAILIGIIVLLNKIEGRLPKY
mgnify:CR=1 FL=1